jgi:hypothetical protein
MPLAFASAFASASVFSLSVRSWSDITALVWVHYPPGAGPQSHTRTLYVNTSSLSRVQSSIERVERQQEASANRQLYNIISTNLCSALRTSVRLSMRSCVCGWLVGGASGRRARVLEGRAYYAPGDKWRWWGGGRGRRTRMGPCRCERTQR